MYALLSIQRGQLNLETEGEAREQKGFEKEELPAISKGKTRKACTHVVSEKEKNDNWVRERIKRSREMTKRGHERTGQDLEDDKGQRNHFEWNSRPSKVRGGGDGVVVGVGVGGVRRERWVTETTF